MDFGKKEQMLCFFAISLLFVSFSATAPMEGSTIVHQHEASPPRDPGPGPTDPIPEPSEPIPPPQLPIPKPNPLYPSSSPDHGSA